MSECGKRQYARQLIADALYDSAYCAGLKHGFSLGQQDDREGLQKALATREGYIALLREAVKLFERECTQHASHGESHE